MDINELKEFIKSLSLEQLESLAAHIFEIISIKRDAKQYNKPNTCPNCNSINCVKNGKVRGKQRFLCKDCQRTFGNRTSLMLSHTKLTDNQWEKYIQCMVQGFSIRKSAEISDVCVKTSFYMRHKILDAISKHMDRANVGGIAELDETFLAESFKGNHKKSGFQMPRPSRKRGKQVKKRGISHEQVCIGTGIDNDGNIIMEMACTGRITGEKLEKLYDGHLNAGTIIITDSLSSYESLSEKLKLRHKQIPTGKHVDDGFSLSSVNSLHSRFKTWMRHFNGVSTKHLANYLTWFKWLEVEKDTQEATKPNMMWKDAMTKPVDARIGTIRQREPGWV